MFAFLPIGDRGGDLNDLWVYNISGIIGEQWRWISGSSQYDDTGSYPSVLNGTGYPSARSAGFTWTGPDGQLWLFGGNADVKPLHLFVYPQHQKRRFSLHSFNWADFAVAFSCFKILLEWLVGDRHGLRDMQIGSKQQCVGSPSVSDEHWVSFK